jgi:outer membrane protein assembly factor BamB
MAGGLPRRAALLGAAAALGGCETIDSLLSRSQPPLPGERRSVLQVERSLAIDPSAQDLTVTLPPAVPLADWPQVGGNIAHVPGHPALGPVLTEAWRSGFGTGSGYRRRMVGGPVVAGGTAYAADAYGTVSAFDAAEGGRRWRTDTRPEEDDAGAIGAGLAVEGDTVFAATGLAELLALDAASGAIRWRVALPAPARGAPTVAGGRVFVPTIENHLVALSAEDGRRQWTHRGQPVPAVPLGLAAPAVEGDIVVGAFASGELVAIRATDGRVVWTESVAPAGASSLAEIAGIRALPAISDGRVIAVGMGGLSIAVDLRSGRRLWEREVGGTEAPFAVGDWVFLLSTDAEVAAVGRDDGRIRWLLPLRPPAEPGRRRRAPKPWAAPVLAGGRLLLAGGEGELVQIDPVAGTIAARQRLPGEVSLQPAVAGGALFIATDDATLVALRGSG